jgi:hypothetical protein|tara:strand:- start:2188 stop:2439 length:252 start_codon:yes stop_codon:yes gene_type:complete
MMTRNEMIEQLQVQKCRVVFKKINGEERDMVCTLMETILPKAKKEDPLTQKKVRAVNEETIVAWDVGKDAFRSFRVENVVSFS